MCYLMLFLSFHTIGKRVRSIEPSGFLRYFRLNRFWPVERDLFHFP